MLYLLYYYIIYYMALDQYEHQDEIAVESMMNQHCAVRASL
jgi:hypothetical protein